MNKYAILIGIAGGTGSGKTSFAKAISSDFGKSFIELARGVYLNNDKRAGESFMLGLRILEGIDRSEVEFLNGQSLDCWREHVIDGHIKDNC